MKIEQAEVTFGACHTFSSECTLRIESESSFRSAFSEAAGRKPEQVADIEARASISNAPNAPSAPPAPPASFAPLGAPRMGDSADSVLALEALIARMLDFLLGHLGLDSKACGLDDLREIPTTRLVPGSDEAAERPLRELTMTRKTTTTERIREQESSDFCARGKLCTADGQTLNFQLDLSLRREFSAERISTRQEQLVLRDPLVINFDGKAAQFSDKRFAFDLDVDGQDESLRVLGGGSGFLAIDRNRDGRVDDGSELFGATSGDGFADLALLDDDGNRWLDESDAAFDQLRVWQFEADGGSRLTSLREQGIGALYLGAAETPFSLTDAENSLLAQIRSSGIYLREDGRAGALHQIDLAV